MANYNRSPSEIILQLLAFSGLLMSVNGGLLKTLEDTVVLVNDSIRLTCQSDKSEEIHFYHNDIRMYAGGIFYSPYNVRFNMTTTGDNTYTLVNGKARPEDAGVYKCWDEEARGQASSADLTVLNTRLLCETSMNAGGYIGPNTCNLQQENMIFSCSVSFNGKPPRLVWRTSNDNRLINSSVCDHQQPNRINCQLTLKSDPSYDGTVFTCQTAQPGGTQYNCSTGVIKVQYFALYRESKPMEKMVDEEVECSVRSNLNPRFKWSLSKGNQETVVSNTKAHVIRDSGLYSCNVSYNIGDVQCSLLASVIYALKPGKLIELTAAHASSVVAITALLLLISTVVGVLFIYRYKQLKEAYYDISGARQYYIIRNDPKPEDSKDSTGVKESLVFTIEDGKCNPGTRVVMEKKKKDSDRNSQLWYDDAATGTIRSKLNDLCLDVKGGRLVELIRRCIHVPCIKGGTLVVRAFRSGDPNQQWVRCDSFIRNRIEYGKSLDIRGENKNSGATLCSWDHTANPNQSFAFEYVSLEDPPSTGSSCPPGQSTQSFPANGASAQRREFCIVSEMHKKVMDIEKENASPGAAVIMCSKKRPPAKSQLWYADQQGVIRSALNDFALRGHTSERQLKLHPFYGNPKQMWRFQGRRIVNQLGLCLDIRGAVHDDGTEVIAYQYKGSKNQHWSAEYVEQKPQILQGLP